MVRGRTAMGKCPPPALRATPASGGYEVATPKRVTPASGGHEVATLKCATPASGGYELATLKIEELVRCERVFSFNF